MKKKFFAAAGLLWIALAFVQLPYAQAPRNGATTLPDHVTLSWTGDPATTMTVTWRTDPSVTDGFVQYQQGTMISPGAPRVKADFREFTTDLGSSRLFSATLVKLTPNRKYSYRVGDGLRWSEMRSFTTADPKGRDFKFLIFGDSQWHLKDQPPYLPWRNTAHNAYSANSDARFIIHTGDLVDFGQEEAHWNAWFAAAEGIIDTIPIMPASGNHESYGQRQISKPRYWLEQFVLPGNGPQGQKNVYSYDYGPVHLVVLDTQQEEQKQHGDILKAQQDWLEKDLAATRARWKIAYFHRPPYSVHSKRDEKEVREAFCAILEKHNVDLVFSGHDHGIARTHPIKNGEPVEKTSQGTVYYIVGHSGGKTYEELEKRSMHAFFLNSKEPNYIVLEVREKKLTAKTIGQDGAVIDTFSVDRKKAR